MWHIVCDLPLTCHHHPPLQAVRADGGRGRGAAGRHGGARRGGDAAQPQGVPAEVRLGRGVCRQPPPPTHRLPGNAEREWVGCKGGRGSPIPPMSPLQPFPNPLFLGRDHLPSSSPISTVPYFYDFFVFVSMFFFTYTHSNKTFI